MHDEQSTETMKITVVIERWTHCTKWTLIVLVSALEHTSVNYSLTHTMQIVSQTWQTWRYSRLSKAIQHSAHLQIWTFSTREQLTADNKVTLAFVGEMPNSLPQPPVTFPPMQNHHPMITTIALYNTVSTAISADNCKQHKRFTVKI